MWNSKLSGQELVHWHCKD